MPTFADGEAALSVFGKLNNSITRTDWCLVVSDVSELANLVYTTGSAFTVAAGTHVVTAKEGFTYEVLASGATEFDIQPGAVKLEALPNSMGFFNFDCMLPAGDGVTDDYAKLAKLLEKTSAQDLPFYSRGPNIFFPGKTYYMGQTLELRQTVYFKGTMGVYPNRFGSRLLFPVDTTGIVVNRYNTDEDGEIDPALLAADWTTIEGMSISGTLGSDKTKHGIFVRARCAMISCAIGGFSGNGISIIAGAGTGGVNEGNANLWYVQNVNSTGNGGWGFFVNGADTNAGNALFLDCTRNGRGGIWDSSFLGNTYIGAHTATNGVAIGLNAPDKSSFVSYGGNRYAAHWTATAAELVATVPGTDPTVWIYHGVGGVHPTIPLWEAGKPEGTYFVGYSIFSDGDSSRNKFINCYSEGGAAGSVIIGNSHFDGGILHSIYEGGELTSTKGGGVWKAGSFSSANAEFGFTTTGNVGAYSFGSVNEPGADYWAMQYANGNFQLQNRNSGSRRAYYLTNENTNDRFKFKFGFQDYLMGSPGSAQYRGIGTAAPITGTWARGDRVENSAPSAGGFAGWVCVTAGTPGTWKGYGVIEA